MESNMASRVLRISFHFAVFVIYLSSESYNFQHVRIPSALTYGGRFKFLTFIDTILQTLFFGLSVVNDLIGSNLSPSKSPQHRSSLQKVRDTLVTAIVFPIGTFVVVTFWGLYFIDRELVFPKHLDAIVPAWLNHVMHTTVILFLLIEKYVVYHQYPSRRAGLIGTIGFALIYQLWVLWIAYHTDIWVYPILEVLSWPGRIGFFAVCWVFLIAFYLLGEKFTNKVWSVSPGELRTKRD